MQFYLSLFGAIAGALSLILHALAPKSGTAATLAADVDKVAAIIPKQ